MIVRYKDVSATSNCLDGDYLIVIWQSGGYDRLRRRYQH